MNEFQKFKCNDQKYIKIYDMVLKSATIPASIQVIAFQNATNQHIKVLDIDSLDTFRLRFKNISIKLFLWYYF